MLRAWWLVATLALFGCRVEGENSAGCEQGILDGDASAAGSDDAVVQLLSEAGPCSGTLIAPNLVLTARHCVALKAAVLAHCRADGTNDDSTGQIQPDLEPSAIEVRIGASPAPQAAARGWAIVSTGNSTICRNDIALVVLDRAIQPASILPLRLTRPTDIGETMTIIGYGENGRVAATIAADDAAVLPVRLRRTGVLVRDVGIDRFSDTGGNAAPGTLMLGPGMCPGDSGGPAIAESTGAVVGVASIIGGSSCADSQYNVYVEVAEYFDIILEALAQAGAEPWLEGEPTVMRSRRDEPSGCAFAWAKPIHQRTGASSRLGLMAVTVLVGLLRARRRKHAASN